MHTNSNTPRKAQVAMVVTVAVIVIAWCSSGTATSAPAPDSITVARLQAIADSAWRMKVVTSRATYELVKPRVDHSGIIVSRASDPPALVTLSDARSEEKRVTWAELERLEVERSAMGRGVAYGAVIGGMTGAVVTLTLDPHDAWGGSEASWMITGIVLSAAAGGLIGLLFGYGTGIGHPIYP